jgi:hypothetical protein
LVCCRRTCVHEQSNLSSNQKCTHGKENQGCVARECAFLTQCQRISTGAGVYMPVCVSICLHTSRFAFDSSPCHQSINQSIKSTNQPTSLYSTLLALPNRPVGWPVGWMAEWAGIAASPKLTVSQTSLFVLPLGGIVSHKRRPPMYLLFSQVLSAAHFLGGVFLKLCRRGAGRNFWVSLCYSTTFIHSFHGDTEPSPNKS